MFYLTGLILHEKFHSRKRQEDHLFHVKLLALNVHAALCLGCMDVGCFVKGNLFKGITDNSLLFVKQMICGDHQSSYV